LDEMSTSTKRLHDSLQEEGPRAGMSYVLPA
jgi:hypothetical protein